MKLSATAAAAALSFGSLASANMATTCPTTDVCYSLVIPDSTAASGSGDIYFQLSAPTTYSWIALGQGTQMVGANIFVMYTDASGENVTLSPRAATGHVMPESNPVADVTLLAGSGVKNGTMMANVLCRNCHAWATGSMDFTAASASWVYAYKAGPAIASNAQDATIRYHDEAAPFTWSLSAAKGNNADTNLDPFVAAAAASTNTPAVGTPPTTSTPDSATIHKPFGGNQVKAHNVVITHGILAGLALVAFFPTGAILVRLGRFPGSIWVHAGIQVFGYMLFVAAVGLGIYIALNLHLLGNHHPIIGLVVFSILSTQSVSGLTHHVLYKRAAAKNPSGPSPPRNIASYIHLYLGRPAVILGIINGGLGIQLAAAGGHPIPRSRLIVYAVFAGIMGTAYLVSIVVGEIMRARARKAEWAGKTTRSDSDDANGAGAVAGQRDVEKTNDATA